MLARQRLGGADRELARHRKAVVREGVSGELVGHLSPARGSRRRSGDCRPVADAPHTARTGARRWPGRPPWRRHGGLPRLLGPANPGRTGACLKGCRDCLPLEVARRPATDDRRPQRSRDENPIVADEAMGGDFVDGTDRLADHRGRARGVRTASVAVRGKCHNRPTRRFNTEGRPVRPDKHYAIQPLPWSQPASHLADVLAAGSERRRAHRRVHGQAGARQDGTCWCCSRARRGSLPTCGSVSWGTTSNRQR